MDGTPPAPAGCGHVHENEQVFLSVLCVFIKLALLVPVRHKGPWPRAGAASSPPIVLSGDEFLLMGGLGFGDIKFSGLGAPGAGAELTESPW